MLRRLAPRTHQRRRGPPDPLPDLTACDSFCCDRVVVVFGGGGGGLLDLNEEVAAPRVLPVSLVRCHITSLQNWFLLSASHLKIRLTFPLLENESVSVALGVGQQAGLVKFPQP